MINFQSVNDLPTSKLMIENMSNLYLVGTLIIQVNDINQKEQKVIKLHICKNRKMEITLRNCLIFNGKKIYNKV